MKTQPLTDGQFPRAEARLPKWMTALAAFASVALLARGEPREAAALALGAALAILNYCWLHDTIQALFHVMATHLPKRVLLKFVLRYPLAVVAIYTFYRLGRLPLWAIFAGLFAPVGGVLIECMVQLKEGFRIRESQIPHLSPVLRAASDQNKFSARDEITPKG